MNIFDMADNSVIQTELAQRVTDWDKMVPNVQAVIIVDVVHRFTHGAVKATQRAEFVTNYVNTVERNFGSDLDDPTEIWHNWAELLIALNFV